jgi:hypothetical protein
MIVFNSVLDLGFVALLIYGTASLIVFIPVMIHILRTKRDVKHKLVWLFICLILGIVGIVIYYFIERRKGKLTSRR